MSRLEEIKQTINHPNYTEHNGQEEIYFMVSDNDFNWLIQQAERVRELEQQNKRYREALEQIANSDGWLIEPNPLCTVEEAYERCVDEAEKALEGEE